MDYIKMTRQIMKLFIYVKLQMMFATKCQSQTSVSSLTRVRLCIFVLPKWERHEGIGSSGML